MLYRSTRDCQASPLLLSFEETVLAGLAPDGGLYIPQDMPRLPADYRSTWPRLSFQELCARLFRLYIDPAEISDVDLRSLVDKSFSTFNDKQVTPVTRLGEYPVAKDAKDAKGQLFLLELYHGPTFAFKDVALQFLGNLFEFFLERRRGQGGSSSGITVVGATSGDTGGAAIYGLRGKENVQLFILHPYQRVSLIQEAQMTTVLDANVHNVAVDGTFDDCQNAVKVMFRNEPFRKQFRLGAINSINWARILAQISYYFYSYFQVEKALAGSTTGDVQVRFSVPTGNFGDVLAGFYARQMGLPIHELVVATNENDILYRFLHSGNYQRRAVTPTLSPAMDIQLSSNFERYLWHLVSAWRQLHFPRESNQERRKLTSETIVQWMAQLAEGADFNVLTMEAPSPEKDGLPVTTLLEMAQSEFQAVRVTNAEVLDTIRRYHFASPPHSSELSVTINKAITLDPHTAIGIKAAETLLAEPKSDGRVVHTVCLATAHPSKFLSAVHQAISQPTEPVSAARTDIRPIHEPSPLNPEVERNILRQAEAGHAPFSIPSAFLGILDKPKRMLRSSANVEEIQQLIVKTLQKQAM